MSRIMVAMSGGVDSSVAALLLQQAGHHVIGATMALWEFDRVGGNTNHESSCCSLSSIEDAKKVCWKIGIKHHVFNLRPQFEREVISDFYDQYKKGLTPNPCVRCNAQIKWAGLLDKALALNCQYLATGHYAALKIEGNSIFLTKGKDTGKDQSYFLWSIKEAALKKTLFPLAQLTKKEVRKLAENEGLPVSAKPESQEICFVPDNDYRRFMREMSDKRGDHFEKGDMVDKSGSILGKHDGLPFYTLGQRKGIGHHRSEPKYVSSIDRANNRIVIGDDEDLFKSGFSVNNLNWIGPQPEKEESFDCHIRIRYRQKEQPGTVTIKGNDAMVEFQESQRAITPGQSAVFYQGNRVLGGGVIKPVI